MGGQALRLDDIDGSRWLADLQSACARNGQSAVMVLADQRGNDFLADDSDTLWFSTQYDTPSQRPDNGVESGAMSFDKDHRTLGERIARALGRRIGYGISRKQLQHALNISGGTVDNLLSGRQDPSPRVFMALLQFFDSAFAHEVLAQDGFTLVKLSDVRAADAMQRYLESVATLKSLEQVRGE